MFVYVFRTSSLMIVGGPSREDIITLVIQVTQPVWPRYFVICQCYSRTVKADGQTT